MLITVKKIQGKREALFFLKLTARDGKVLCTLNLKDNLSGSSVFQDIISVLDAYYDSHHVKILVDDKHIDLYD